MLFHASLISCFAHAIKNSKQKRLTSPSAHPDAHTASLGHAAGLLRRSTEQPSSPATRSLLKHDDTKNGLIQSEEKSRSFQCASRISIKS